jgi:hypothetical protein
MDLGEHYSLVSTSKKLTGLDITTRDMGSPILLNAVAAYHISIHEAIIHNDDAERMAAIIAAQHDFEETCTDLATSMASGGQAYGHDND